VAALESKIGHLRGAAAGGDAHAAAELAAAEAERSHYSGLVEQIDTHAAEMRGAGVQPGETVQPLHPSAGASTQDELVNYHRQRADFYDAQASQLSDPAARANARELAASYRAEAGRLGVAEAPAPEGYDVSGAKSSPTPSSTAPSGSLLGRVGRTAVDLVQLPKAKAGFDLSATGRQALPQILAHPTYFKDAMAAQVKAFASEGAYNSFVASIRGRDDFELMQRSGLYLSSAGSGPEEAFASRLVKSIPGVKGSERAYSAALDSVRTQAWDAYTAALADNPNVTDETYKAIADLVNISTGRGVMPILDRSALGRKFVNALNVPFFSPRNTASKFNLLSPVRIVRNALDPATRPVAWLQMRDATRGLAVMGTTLGLAHLAGLDASVNPFSNDFGKLRVGNAVYDLTGGEGMSARFLAQMSRSFLALARGKHVLKGQAPVDLTRHYLRSQLQPAASVAVDLRTGKTYEGEPATYTKAAADLVVPFVVDDVYKGWVDAGGSSVSDVGSGQDFKTAFKGAARGVPGVFGVGTNFYPKRARGQVKFSSP
jgi:hypothetical protein